MCADWSLLQIWGNGIGLFATILIIWIATVKYRRNRKQLARTYAEYPRKAVPELERDKEQRNILVIGGAGFLGRRIVKHLLRTYGDGVHVHIFDVSLPPLDKRNPYITYVLGDIRVYNHVEKAVKGIEGPMHTVFHLASLLPGVRNTDQLLQDVICKGTENVLEACKDVGGSTGRTIKLVYTSSALVALEKDAKELMNADETMAVPRTVATSYHAFKAKAERLVRNYDGENVAACILRPTMMFGKGDKVFCDLLLQGQYPVVIGNGDNILDFVFVDDVATGHVLAEENMSLENTASSGTPAPVYILGGSHMRLNDFIYGNANANGSAKNNGSSSDASRSNTENTGADVRNKTMWHTRPPIHIRYVWVAKWMAFFNEMVYDLFSIETLPMLTLDNVTIMRRTAVFDSAKAAAQLGYKPSQDIPAIVAHLVAQRARAKQRGRSKSSK